MPESTRHIVVRIPTARDQLVALGLSEEDVGRSLALLAQAHGPVEQLPPGEYAIDLPVESPPEQYTNQQVITAIYRAAEAMGEDGWALLSRAGLTHLIGDRQAAYEGLPMAELPGLTPEERAWVHAALAGEPFEEPELVAPSIVWKGPTVNRDLGRAGQPIDLIVIHYTANGSAAGAIAWFKKPSAEVSAHYVIDRGGEIFQLVRDGDAAWHAGQGSIPGLSDAENARRRRRNSEIRPNQRGIGIEIVNWGLLQKRDGTFFNWTSNWTGVHHGNVVSAGGRHWEPFTEPQYESLIELVSYLCDKHDVPVALPPQGPGTYHEHTEDLAVFRGILGHDAMDSAKVDPGDHFDWERLRAGVEGAS